MHSYVSECECITRPSKPAIILRRFRLSQIISRKHGSFSGELLRTSTNFKFDDRIKISCEALLDKRCRVLPSQAIDF